MIETPSEVIDDWRRPRLPLPMRWANATLRPLSRRAVSLEPGALLEAAEKQTGLSDFGDESFLTPLGVLTDALETEADLSAFGRFSSRQFLLQLLANRLKLEALLTAHPEILDEQIRAPIFIVGLPRTGTTHLHNLVAETVGP